MKRNLFVLLILVAITIPVAAWSAGAVLGSVTVYINGPSSLDVTGVLTVNQDLVIGCYNPSTNDTGGEDNHIVKTFVFSTSDSETQSASGGGTMTFLDDATKCNEGNGEEWRVSLDSAVNANVKVTVVITNDADSSDTKICDGTIKDLDSLNGNQKLRCS